MYWLWYRSLSVQEEEGLSASVEMGLLDLECWPQQVALREGAGE